MIVYIKKACPKKFVILDLELDNNLYSDIGITFLDYELGSWVKLSNELVEFYNEHPNASVEEVWSLTLNEDSSIIRTLNTVKEDAIKTIEMYDKSTAVNGFILNDVIRTWFTVQERLNYKLSVEAAKLLGEYTLDFLVEGMPFTVSVDDAEYMLAQILRYADKCYIVTALHIANVNNMTSIEEIELYDYTVGYPEMLKFELL